jgi:hypothetical protein
MRRIAMALVPLVAASFAVVGGNVAHANTSSYCGVNGSGQPLCNILETMNNGYCMGAVVNDTGGSYVKTLYTDMPGTGYDCQFWMERNVNNTGWYDESGVKIITPGTVNWASPEYWDGPGYQARVCFQFLWSGTSQPGAAHCSGALGGFG